MNGKDYLDFEETSIDDLYSEAVEYTESILSENSKKDNKPSKKTKELVRDTTQGLPTYFIPQNADRSVKELLNSMEREKCFELKKMRITEKDIGAKKRKAFRFKKTDCLLSIKKDVPVFASNFQKEVYVVFTRPKKYYHSNKNPREFPCECKFIIDKKIYSFFKEYGTIQEIAAALDLFKYFTPKQQKFFIEQASRPKYEINDSNSCFTPIVDEDSLIMMYRICRDTYSPEKRAEIESLIQQLDGKQRGETRDNIITQLSYALCIDDVTVKNPRKKTFDEIIAILDKYVYGMLELKERVAEYVIALQHSDVKGFSLLLVGPPGVGKTSIARAFSEIFEYEFVEIDCSGRNLVSIGGISSVYGGSKPGEIMQKTIEKSTTNYVLLLDELGQMVADDKDGDAYSVLGSMLGLQKKVNDRYLPFGISVKNSIVIGTTNDIASIPGYIRNRFEDNIFYLPGYGVDDKVNIAQNYAIPEKLTEFKISNSELKFKKEALIEIATAYCSDEGMREMRGYIKSLIIKAITGWDRKILPKPLVIDVDFVKKNLRHNGRTKNKMGY